MAIVRRILTTIAIVITCVVPAACSSDSETRTIFVPTEVPSIQEAVQKARSGDLILIAPGTYHEAVNVSIDGITIRGQDRNGVVLDGLNKLANGFYVSADNVSIENLTIHGYTQNGVVFNGVSAVTNDAGVDPGIAYGTEGYSLVGYRIRYVTAYNNGLYGIYAFSSTVGVVENSYVSGHPDSGLYIGQCKPCNAVVSNVIAERNAIGYYGTNASGQVYVINSTFKQNRLGIAPNSQMAEQLAPQEETFIVGNRVIDNDNPSAPAIPKGFFGGGIAVGGGTKNKVLRNLVTDHSYVGIIVTKLSEFLPSNNVVEGNVLKRNKVDLAFDVSGPTGSLGNCFADNVFTTASPIRIENAMPCTGTTNVKDVNPIASPSVPPQVDYRLIASPSKQTTMPTAELNAPILPIQFVQPSLGEILVPTE